jgi:hypothetical protein
MKLQIVESEKNLMTRKQIIKVIQHLSKFGMKYVTSAEVIALCETALEYHSLKDKIKQ